MTTALLIALIAVPALALILWPLFARKTAAPDRVARQREADCAGELNEEKRALYRALREIEFDYRAGHLAEDDYQALRSRYEGRAAQVLKELDQLEASRSVERRREPQVTAAAPIQKSRAWTRSPLGLTVGALVLVVFGVTLGLGVSRYTEPDQTVVPPGSRLPVPAEAPPGPMAGASSRPIPPEMLAGMLQAARQSLTAGRYQEAIAAYQAVLKRDQKNVDALTHLALIVAIGGHTDAALESLDKVLKLDPAYPAAHLYRGQILHDAKKDYRGAIQAWEKFLALVPDGEDRTRVTRMIQEAKGRLLSPKP